MTHVRTALAEKIQQARSATDSLFALLEPHALYERPVAERHRLIFYLGHLEAFDWNQICRGALGVPSFQPQFDQLFEFGIDPRPGSAEIDSAKDWPSVDAIADYNRRIREKIDAIVDEAPEQILHVALEHRLMHAETLAYLLHQLPHGVKYAPRQAPPIDARLVHGSQQDNRPNIFLGVPAGEVTLGQEPGEFGWDNEFSRHRVHVPDFRMSQFKITNGEYLAFVNAGGPPPPFWTLSRQASAQCEWSYNGMFETMPLPLAHPVYATQEQANAYAEWRGARLPSEAEFHRAAYGTPDSDERAYPWGSAEPSSKSGSYDFRAWDPVPVTANPDCDSAFGLSQMIGNGWEWTSTKFHPFPGFSPFPFYSGYSQNFFDDEHYVLKGGSCRTGAALLRRSFRNWFRPDYPYAYTTFRLVTNA